MLTSNQKYVDPTQLVHSVVDDENNKVRVGDEMDVTEYLLNLIERMEEGLDEFKEKSPAAQPVEEESSPLFRSYI